MNPVAPFDLQQDGIDSESCFRTVFACSPIGIALVAPDGRWLRVNRALCEVVGYSDAELRATTFQAITHPDDLESDLELFAQTIRGERDGYEMEKRYFHKDGRTIWVLLDVRLVRDWRTEQPLYFISQVQDITARKQAEAARRAACEETERANAAKSEFLSRISHELRTPLNVILGFGQLLEIEREMLTETQAESVGHILTAGSELLTLVNQVLKVSQTQGSLPAADLRGVEINATAQEAMTAVGGLAAQKDVRITLEKADGAPCALGDQVKLEEVLEQLLTNAIQHSQAGGVVRLRCQCSGATVRYEVADSGTGIAAEELEKIFWPFYRATTVQHFDGVGLGLYLARAMAESFGGTLGVRSTPGRGSVFSVELPLHESPMRELPLDDLTAWLACEAA